MGGRKSRLLVGDRPLAARHVERLLAAGATRVLVVLGPDDRDLDLGGARVVLSSAPDQAGSLSVALAALDDDEDSVFVTPVDALPAAVGTLSAIGAALASADAAIPTYRGQGGHPIAARRAVLEAGRGRPLRDVLRDLGERCVRVAVEDANVVTDLDTPEDAERALGERPRFWA